jgi:hypothetical protein
VQDKTQRKPWIEPKIIRFGDIEELTQASNKNFGIGDSFTFQGATTRLSS